MTFLPDKETVVGCVVLDEAVEVVSLNSVVSSDVFKVDAEDSLRSRADDTIGLQF